MEPSPTRRSTLSEFRTLLQGVRRGEPYEIRGFGAIYDKMVAGVTHEASGKRILGEIGDHVAHGGRVLDVGSGTGRDAVALARTRPDLEVVGAEPHGPMLEQAQTLDAPGNLSWVQATASALPFPDGHFDAIYSCHAIKHFPRPRSAVAEMLRVLAPGGLAVIAEVSPWVPLTSTWQVARHVSLPFFLRPILAVRLRNGTAKLLPREAETVAGWFTGHEGIAPFEGLDDLADADGTPGAYWIARLHRPR